jgi:anthranilate phosphoribosyltransferase
MVFRGDDGLDELSTTTTSHVWDVDGSVRASSFDPASLGIARATLADLKGGTPEENAKACLGILEGAEGAVRDAVVLNAAAALAVAGTVQDIANGIGVASESLDSGAAARALEMLRETSQRLA